MSDRRTSGQAWTRRLDMCIEVPAVIVAFVMMTIVTDNAVSRAFLNSPISYTTEMTQYWFMPVLALLGFMAAQRRGQHIAADLLYARLTARAQQGALVALYSAVAILVAAIAYYGWGEAVDAYEIRMRAGISPLPAWPVYFLVPVTFAVMTLQFLAAAVGIVRRGVVDEHASPEIEPGAEHAGSVKES